MASVAGGRGSRQLLINTSLNDIDGAGVPSTPSTVAANELESKEILTLSEAWDNAKTQFQKRTAKSIDTPQRDLNKFMESWASEYEADDSEKARKKKKCMLVIQNILDGINIVGGIVAQATSMVFGFAGPCFNALSFLLEMYGRIRKVFDTVMEMFEEVADFLLRFKVLKRIDDQTKLPSEMITSAGRLLISFVDICGLSIELLQEHRHRTSLKAAFLNSDSGAGESLAQFRRMALSLDRLTHTVALEKIYEGNETGRDTFSLVRQQSATLSTFAVTLKSLEQANNDDKTMKVNEKRLAFIKDKLFSKEEQSLDSSVEVPGHLLPNTLVILEKDASFKQWQDASSVPGRTAFILKGPAGSGKSCALELLKRSLDERRRTADREDPSLYVAYHKFGSLVSKGSDSVMPFALKNIAMQVSQQSTAYASELENILKGDAKKKTIIQEPDIDKLWSSLRLSTFNTKSKGATMFLMFDNIEKEAESISATLIDLFTGSKAERAKNQDKLSIRVIFAVDSEKRQVDSSIMSMNMTDVTRDLLESYTITELKRMNIFQSADRRSVKRRKEVVKAVKASANQAQGAWSFRNIQHKLEQIAAAIENDASSKKFFDILHDDDQLRLNVNARESISALSETLTTKEISQINQLLPWLLYSEYADFLELEELEAILYLAHDSDSLQSLGTKINERFQELLCIKDGYIILRPEKADVLREIGDQSLSKVTIEEPVINLELSIRNAKESIVRQFVWELNQQMSEGHFNFASYVESGRTFITVNKLKGHLSVTKMCLKLLNEGWHEETEILVRYARDFLPMHFIYLKDNMSFISTADQVAIGHGLVTFLSEPYYLYEDPDKHFGWGHSWLLNTECTEAVIAWLREVQDKLQTRERLWIKKVLSPGRGQLPHLMDVARAVGRKWMLHDKDDAAERYTYTIVRTSRSLEPTLYRWLNTYIEQNGRQHEQEPASAVEMEDTAELQNNGTVADDELDTIETEALLEKNSETAPAGSENQNKEESASVSDAAQIKNAIMWLKDNEIFSRETGVSYLNIGYTFLWHEAYDEAESRFEQAIKHDQTKAQGLIGLARTHFAREDKNKAINEYRRAILILKDCEKRDRLIETQKKLLAETYRELAMIYGETQSSDLELTFDCYVNSLKYDDDLAVRWRTLEFLCQIDMKSNENRALQRLKEWYGGSDEAGAASVSEVIKRSVDYADSCRAFSSFIHAIRDSDLRSYVIKSMSDAIRLQETLGEAGGKTKLLYYQGVAVARGGVSNRWSSAVDLWKDAINAASAGTSTDEFQRVCLCEAVNGLIQYEFDLKMQEISADGDNSQMSSEEKASIVRHLEHSIAAKVRSLPDMTRLQDNKVTDGYLVSMNIMLGRVKEAHQLLIEGLSTSCEVLSDEDGDNDYFGVFTLMTALLSIGDRAGVLTAFSLFDRKRPQLKNAKTQSSSPSTTIADPPLGEDDKSAVVPVSIGYEAFCDGCRKDVKSTDQEGIWWCRYCRDFDLCHQCYGLIKKGELFTPRCRSDHEFIRLYHIDYEEEEKLNNMVKIDWKWKDLDRNNGTFERVGGRIAPLSEWLDQLKREWNVPESSTNTRAQK